MNKEDAIKVLESLYDFLLCIETKVEFDRVHNLFAYSCYPMYFLLDISSVRRQCFELLSDLKKEGPTRR